MAIEDTFGYRFVRTSLVMLNCIVLLRLLSLLLQYSHVLEPTFVLFVLLIGSNFMIAIIGAIREHRVSVILTGSVTLIMFLSLIFTAKENKGVNLFLLILLAISVQSLIFSEMLKERQTMLSGNRRGINYIGTVTSSGGGRNGNPVTAISTAGGQLASVVVYETGGANLPAGGGGLFMLDPEIGSELAKDPPPSYFTTNCPPPKYEDAIKLNAGDLSLPVVLGATNQDASEAQIISSNGTSVTSASTSTPSSAAPSFGISTPAAASAAATSTNTTTTTDTESIRPRRTRILEQLDELLNSDRSRTKK